jgi:hypothetical protein
MPLAALHLADGPAMYFGGTIMTFALPYGAFIVAAGALFFLFRAKHPAGPKLKYTSTAFTTSVFTREPGPVPAPPVSAAAEPGSTAAAEPESTAAGEPEPSAAADTAAEPETKPEPESEQ